MKPAVQRVASIQPQILGVWMIPTLSQTSTSLLRILEDIGDWAEGIEGKEEME